MIYEPTRVYKDVVSNIKRVNLLRGGTRSTKSFSLTQMAVRWLLYGKIGNVKKKGLDRGTFFILRESFPALRRTVMADFIMILDREGLYKHVNHVKTTNEFKSRDGKRTVSFFSADDESKLRGPQGTLFWINEATAVTENVFNQLIFRCSHFCFLDYNPINSESWIKETLEEVRFSERGDVSLDISTVHDNPFLSPEQFNEILAIKDEDLRKVYLEGRWAKLSGLIYPNFEQIDKLPTDYDKRYYGIDFGWIDPTALIEVRQKGMNLYIKEHIYESKYDLSQLSNYINSKFIGCRGAADGASPRHIYDLQQRGVRVKAAKKGQDSILQGIIHVRTHNLFVTSDSINLIKELRSYKFQKDKEGNEIQKPIDEYNHCFPEGTLIETMHRQVPIEYIQEGDTVLTSHKFREVNKVFNNGVKQVTKYRLHFDTFSISLECTSDHKIKTHKGWIEIAKLKKGLEIYLIRDLIIKNTISIRGNDTFLKEQIDFIWLFGNILTAKFQKAITYIIKMVTLKIITLATSILLKRNYTYEWRAKKDLEKTLCLQNNSIVKELRQLKHGIPLMRGNSGTQSMDLNHGLAERKQQLIVFSAEKNTRLISLQGQNTAIIIAALKRLEIVGKRKAIVYDLNVDRRHEYFANGVLVHNCLDALRYAVSTFSKKRIFKIL